MGAGGSSARTAAGGAVAAVRLSHGAQRQAQAQQAQMGVVPAPAAQNGGSVRGHSDDDWLLQMQSDVGMQPHPPSQPRAAAGGLFQPAPPATGAPGGGGRGGGRSGAGSAAAAALPAGWSSAVSRSTGRVYYVNELTGDTQFERPSAPASYEEMQVRELALVLVLAVVLVLVVVVVLLLVLLVLVVVVLLLMLLLTLTSLSRQPANHNLHGSERSASRMGRIRDFVRFEARAGNHGGGGAAAAGAASADACAAADDATGATAPADAARSQRRYCTWWRPRAAPRA